MPHEHRASHIVFATWHCMTHHVTQRGHVVAMVYSGVGVATDVVGCAAALKPYVLLTHSQTCSS